MQDWWLHCQSQRSSVTHFTCRRLCVQHLWVECCSFQEVPRSEGSRHAGTAQTVHLHVRTGTQRELSRRKGTDWTSNSIYLKPVIVEQVFYRLYQYYIVNLFKTELADQISHADTELLDSPKDNGSRIYLLCWLFPWRTNI